MMLDYAHRALPIVITHEHGDSVQRVEKKMRIELRLQRREPRARELFRKSCDLHFTFARFDEVTRRVFDADDAEINLHAKRQGGEDPTQPFNADLTPEVRRVLD